MPCTWDEVYSTKFNLFICFIGTSNVEQPSNLRTRHGDSNFVYSWEYRNETVVDHYQLDLEWDQDDPRYQTVLVTSKNVTIPCSPGVSYNATVRAVTVCPGIMSDPTSFPSKYYVNTCVSVIIPHCVHAYISYSTYMMSKSLPSHLR